MSVIKVFYLCLYYGIGQFVTDRFGVGKIVRYHLVKHIFKSCGKNVNVERRAHFGTGDDIEIGDNSGIGINARIPSHTIIGKNVMMGPNCYIFAKNHRYDRTDIPMCQQGDSDEVTTIIKDDVWIGRNVMIMPGRVIETGSIVAAGCVLSKNFPPYSIIGGNPSRIIKMRLINETNDNLQ